MFSLCFLKGASLKKNYSGDAKMKKSTTQFFFPSTKGFVGSKGEIAAYMLILFFAVKVGR